MIGPTIVAKLWKPVGVESRWSHLLQRCSQLKSFVQQSTARTESLEIVGRLDKDSEGLLLLTTNATLRAQLLTTRSGNEHGSLFLKQYRVRTNFPMSDEQIQVMRHGVTISTLARRRGGEKRVAQTLPCVVDRDLDFAPSGKVIVVTLREGRNRQIRKMVGSFGHRVASLRRLTFGPIGLDGLDGPGSLTELNDAEVDELQATLPLPLGGEEPSFPWRQRICDEEEQRDRRSPQARNR